MFAILVAGIQGYHTPGTLGCVLLGIGVGIYCSVRGLQDMVGLGWYRRRLATRPERDD